MAKVQSCVHDVLNKKPSDYSQQAMRFGIDTRILKHLSLEEALKHIREHFQNVEICASHIRKLLERHSFEEAIGIVKKLVRDFNVRVRQIHAPYGDVDLWLVEGDKREKALEVLTNFIKLCNAVECPVLVVHVPFCREVKTRSFIELIEIERDATKYLMRSLDKVLQDFNVKIAFENRLEQAFGTSPKDVYRLIIEEGVENFGLCLDTGHAHVNKIDIVSIVQYCGDRIFATHIHDNDGAQDRHLPPLMGTIRWREVITALYRYTNAPLILEVEPICPDAGLNTLLLCKLVVNELRSLVHE